MAEQKNDAAAPPPHVHVAVIFFIKEDKVKDFMDASKIAADATAKNDKGCIRYSFHQHVKNENQFAVIEEWESEADLEAHGKKDHVAKFREAVSALKEKETLFFFLGEPLFKLEKKNEKQVANKDHIHVVVAFTIKPNKFDDFIAVYKEPIALTNEEKGCIRYNGHQGIKDKSKVIFLEEWDNEASIDQHIKTKHISEMLPKLGELAEFIISFRAKDAYAGKL